MRRERIIYLVGRKKFDEETYIELYTMFIHPPRMFIRFRDIATGRFVPFKPIFRVTYAIQVIPIHEIYYSSIGHLHGSEYVCRRYESKLYDEFIRWTEEHIGYPQEEWWGTISEINRSETMFTAIRPEHAEDIFNEINNIHLIWEEEKVVVDEEVVETGYG